MAIGVLHVVGGNDRGKQFNLSGAETRIGRGTDQDVVLSDIAVSRRHFTVSMAGARYQINDLGSGNGTLLNGQKVNTTYLNDGDHIEIGNTVMRFNQAVEASAGGAPSYSAPPAYAPPVGLPAAPPGYSPPPAYPPSPAAYPVSAPLPAPSPNVQQPNRPLHGAATQAPQMVGQATQAPTPSPIRPAPSPTMAASAPLASMAPRAATPAAVRRPPPPSSSSKGLFWYGSMALVWVASGAVIASKTVLAKPEIVPSEAEESYRQGVRLFTGSQYADAKVAFSDAAKKAPDAPDAQRYLAACDVELRSRASWSRGEAALSAHRYLDAMNAFAEIDPSSQLYEQSRRARRDQGPQAAIEEVGKAEKFASSDSAQALIHARSALSFDPNNADAQRLVVRLRGGSTAVAPVVQHAAPVVVAVQHESTKEPHHTHTTKTPIAEMPATLPTPKVGKGDAGAVTLPDIKAAFSAYKNKDFSTAANLIRAQAVSQPSTRADKLIGLANEVAKLQTDLAKGASDETGNPDAALTEYSDALSIDARDGRSTHAAFIKGKLGKAQLGVANTRFKQGKYDQAMQLLSTAQKMGSGDSIGLGKQLADKANELLAKGQAAQKSNPAQAKTYFRQVMKMVPVGSPTYASAYKLVNTTTAAKRDEDED